ncbi:MAG TPA: prepilin peptidase [Mariprofundaceae bacterium]|nr:prepilin peptidase [Mariprofundaceae bacterium]
MIPLVAIAGLFGLLVGSFANVCVHRIPRHESISFPGSHCPACAHAIAWYDNVPLLSYLLLGGRCRHCGTHIAWRYPVLEGLMGASWAALAWHFGPTLALPMALVLVTLLWILTLIDLETGLLPDALTLPGIGVGLGFSFWLGDPVASLIGAVAGYGIFWLVARVFVLVTGREGLGYGDFKLLAMLGAFFGWKSLPFIVFTSSLAGAVVGGLYLWLGRRGMRVAVPYGPFLAAGGVAWLLWGQDSLRWYLGMAGG